MLTTHLSVMLPITYIFASLIVSVLKTIHALSHHSPSVFPVVLFYVNALLLSYRNQHSNVEALTYLLFSCADKECSAVVDIAFVIDSSGSIGRKNWEKMKRFLKALVSKLDVRRSATHIAAVAYSNNAVVVTRFSDIQSTIEVNRKLDGMRWQRGFTYTDKALLLADRDLFQTANGMRSRAPKVRTVKKLFFIPFKTNCPLLSTSNAAPPKKEVISVLKLSYLILLFQLTFIFEGIITSSVSSVVYFSF